MTIRLKLLSIIALLAAVVIGFRISSALDATARLAEARSSLAINEISGSLLASGNDLAKERGLTNMMLAGSAAVSAADREQIDGLRASARSAIESARTEIAAIGADSDPDVRAGLQSVDEALGKLSRLRADLAADSGRSNPKLTDDWFPTITALIMRLDDLRRAVEGRLMQTSDGQVAQSFMIQNALWELREFAGRERGGLGGLIAAGRPMTLEQLQTHATARGRVESAWSSLHRTPGILSKDFEAQKAEIQDQYFTKFQKLRESVYRASAERESYPVSASEWVSRATAGLDPVLVAQKTVSRDVATLLERIASEARSSLTEAVFVLLAVGGFCVFAGFVIVGHVTRPLTKMTRAMGELAKDNLDVEVPVVRRKDEVGAIARAMGVFKMNAAETRQFRANAEWERQTAETDRCAALAGMAATVEAETGSAVSQVGERTQEMARTADDMSASALRVSANSQAVAAAAEQALANAQTVASATEELSCSIREISTQVTNAATATSAAVDRSDHARATIVSLVEAVARVGQVTTLISKIASQTNLLALNATIEAARAGEAGKGFAVVASEVKALSLQTAQSTGDINRHIGEIQRVTDEAVRSMDEVSKTVRTINEITGSIAAAVEQQNAATGEIARNVTETAHAAQEVSARIAEVSAEAARTGAHASEVHATAESVTGATSDLQLTIMRALKTFAEDVDRRLEKDYILDSACRVTTGDGQSLSARTRTISRHGAVLSGADHLRVGNKGRLHIAEIGEVPFRVARLGRDTQHLEFDGDSQALQRFSAYIEQSAIKAVAA